MKHFFIISLPRSRSAWLANFLTAGDGFCFHEALRSVQTLDEYEQKVKAETLKYESVGDADPSLVPVLGEIVKRFPDAKFVVVRRDVLAVGVSHAAAFPKLVMTTEQLVTLDKQIEALLTDVNEDQVMEVAFEDLDLPQACNAIHQFCLGRPMDALRWQLLNELRVTVIAEKAAVTFAPWVRAQLTAQSYPVTPASAQWNALMSELCAERKDALTWLTQLWGLAMTWDHLVDGDLLDLPLAERTFEALLLEWPANPFWKSYAAALMPVLANALAAWRTGERARDYDIYCETACTVAFCLGGNEMVKRFSPRIRATVKQLLDEDNEKDGQS